VMFGNQEVSCNAPCRWRVLVMKETKIGFVATLSACAHEWLCTVAAARDRLGDVCLGVLEDRSSRAVIL
jgi:hypothetical protein